MNRPIRSHLLWEEKTMGWSRQHFLMSAILFVVVATSSFHFFALPWQLVYSPSYSLHPGGKWSPLSDFETTRCPIKLTNTEVPVEWEHRCPKTGIVSVMQGGRFGNIIWEYATMFATAKKTGLPAFAPTCIIQTLSEYFESLSVPPLSYVAKCPIDKSLTVNSLSSWKDPRQSIVLPMYSAHWRIVVEWLDDVRREFIFNANLRDSARSVLSESAKRFQMTRPTFVGIHVRRTDFIQWIWTNLKIRPAPPSYYHNAMDYFEKRYKDVIFVIATDSVDWCRKNLMREKSRVDVVSERNEKGPVRDLAVLSSCNHSIIDYGTYGTWAALAAAGDTVVYNVTGYFSTLIAAVLPNWTAMN